MNERILKANLELAEAKLATYAKQDPGAAASIRMSHAISRRDYWDEKAGEEEARIAALTAKHAARVKKLTAEVEALKAKLGEVAS